MKRWNGWGDDTFTYPLPQSAAAFLQEAIGPATPPRDATLSEAVDTVPASRLPAHALVDTDATGRIAHARGQSLPDWIALRSGRIPTFPDGVAYPATGEQVRKLLSYAGQVDARLIPYGGGSSVVGHVNVLPGDAPVLTVDLTRMNRLLALDEVSHVATFGAGVYGPDLEAQLRARNFTLGHFPQSFEFSTLGGWIVTRSNGQQSLGYGRIEAMFAGGRLESPAGTLVLPPFPASAAGPDLREVLLGSEGRLGILTEATVRIRPVAACEEFRAVFFPDFERGQAAVREMMQARLPLSMLRLSTPAETETTLAMAGHEQAIAWLKGLLRLRRIGDQRCMLILGITGSDASVLFGRDEALAAAREHGGVHTGQIFGNEWRKNRFRSPYLRNSLWEAGYALDTLETATAWSNVSDLLQAIEQALHRGLQDVGERVLVFSHLSHTYPWGTNIYTTYLYRIPANGPKATFGQWDAAETLRRWQVLKTAASEAIVAGGGTITHQHGIGTDHLPYLSPEKGALGLAALGDLCERFDPYGIMNPGKLVLRDARTRR
ncbi:MAG: FAD-binding oxidoreductase [Chloroflexi bacterium]|nr:FAD-binding oxidoreductase [Chloroflexota bacterium]